MFDTFEGTYAEKAEGSVWIRGSKDQILCEAFFAGEDESIESMEASGYILVPYEFEGEPIFVEVAG